MRKRRKLPFESTLPPALYARIELVCNGWDGLSSEDRLDIVLLLRSVPIQQRTSLVLKAQGYSFAEIGRLTHVSHQTASVRVRRAEYWIRGRLDGHSDSSTG